MDRYRQPGRQERMTPLGRVFDAGARRALQRVPSLRRATRTPAAQQVIHSLRGSRQVTQPVRFLAGQLAARGPQAYRLRDSGLEILVRHRSPDVEVLNEIYRERLYRLRPEVEPLLCELGRPPRAVDLGGNIGLFGTWFFERFPHGRVMTLEPDPANAALAREVIRRNGLGDRWELIEACAAPADGTVPFLDGHFIRSRIPQEGEPATREVRAVDALRLAAGADLLKVDIEGGEWPLLEDPRFRALTVPVIAMEWHVMSAPVPPEQAQERACSALRDAGYVVAEDPPIGGPLSGTLWAWRPPGPGRPPPAVAGAGRAAAG